MSEDDFGEQSISSPDRTLAAVTAVLAATPARSRRTAELRAAIMAVARVRIHDRGYVACSLRELASEVGTTATTIVRQFGGKYGLLSAIYEESYEAAVGWLQPGPAASVTPAQVLIASVKNVIDKSSEFPQIGDFLIANSGNTDFLLAPTQVRPGSGAVQGPFEQRFNDWFLARCSECIGEGHAPGMSAVALCEAVLGILERFLLSEYLRRRTQGRRYPYVVDWDASRVILEILLNDSPTEVAIDRGPAVAYDHVSRVAGWSDTSRDRLLASAWVEFGGQGYGRTTTRVIARGARTSESELFRQFPSGKFDLLKAIYDRCYDVVLGDLSRLEGTPVDLLVNGTYLLWHLYESEPTLSKFLIFNSGNADSLLLMPRDAAVGLDETALTSKTDEYFAWFVLRARDAVPDACRDDFGDALGQVVVGIAERAMLTWYRDDYVRSSARTISAQDAVAPLIKILEYLPRTLERHSALS